MEEKGKSFTKVCQEFFSEGKHGRKMTIPEFKALTVRDKIELSTMLNEIGYPHIPYEPLPGMTAA